MHVGVNIQISLLLEEQNHSQGVNCNMTQSLPKLQSQPLLKKKQLAKQSLHELNQQWSQ